MAHRHDADRFVLLRIESLVLGVDALDAESHEHPEELIPHEPHTFDDRGRIATLMQPSVCPFDWQKRDGLEERVQAKTMALCSGDDAGRSPDGACASVYIHFC